MNPPNGRFRWWAAVAVFVLTTGLQLWFIARAGTDIPYQDQWDVEGAVLYPKWQEGTLSLADLIAPHNEHRIFCTRLLSLGLFVGDRQWDPLVQLGVDAFLRGFVAMAIFLGLAGADTKNSVQVLALGLVTFTFLPHLGWFNALWGFQSQIYFSILFSVLAIRWLCTEPLGKGDLFAGIASGVAAQFAMSAGAFVPVALMALVIARVVSQRKFEANDRVVLGVAAALLGLCFLLRAPVPAHTGLHASSAGQFWNIFLRIAAWPHDHQPVAGLALNAPMLVYLGVRLRSRGPCNPSGEFAWLLAIWALAGAAAVAWYRGGGVEFSAGVPPRYGDFFMLLPLGNAWCAFLLAHEVWSRRPLVLVFAGVWCAFVFVGWLGLSAQIWRGLVLPRIRDRDAPVRLATEFQQTGDEKVFQGQWRVLVPHPNPDSVRRVLRDPRMTGHLPPSLQPDRPMGPLSRAVRWLLGR